MNLIIFQPAVNAAHIRPVFKFVRILCNLHKKLFFDHFKRRPVKAFGKLFAGLHQRNIKVPFPLSELPELAKGKGNKIISIPSARVQNREEFVVAVAIFAEDDQIEIWAGKRKMGLQFSDLEHYSGERGRRGHKLPRGLQRVDGIKVIHSASSAAALAQSEGEPSEKEQPDNE